MASSVKIRKRVERSKNKEASKSKRRQLQRAAAYRKAKQKEFLQSVKDTLGFNKIRIKGVKTFSDL